ncbi:MAG: Gfo/Idh/MocA family protein [Haloarculaceae archaeon]
MTDPTEARIGFVGLGNIAQLHADQLGDIGIPVTAGMDVLEEAREAFAAEYGAETYDDHEEMFEAVDAVIVSTPNRFHADYVVDALDAGLDVLVEKPLSNTLEGAERIAEAARDAEGLCMVGFHNRFRAPVQVLREYDEAGEMGEINHVEANFVRRRGVPGRGSWFTQKDMSGGGSVIDLGVHAIDLALYLLDYPDVAEVSATTRSQFGTREEDYTYLSMWGDDQDPEAFDVDDSASAFIRTEDGRTISLEVAWAANRQPSQEFVVRGDGAGAHLDLATDDLSVLETSNAGADHHRTTDVETAGREAHGLELERFAESVVSGEDPGINTVEEGLTVQRVMDGIYRSSEAGEAVDIE